jgi:alpha-glucosidase (family GH31 glycosyl hydrolase)
LREQLLPYIVDAATRAGESGLPIVRPLSFLDRTDPELQDRWDQYLFGPDLLVAPIWRIGQRSREVYFPAGTWRSLWNESERFEGPATVELEAPLDTILVFIRGDALSPLVPVSD